MFLKILHLLCTQMDSYKQIMTPNSKAIFAIISMANHTGNSHLNICFPHPCWIGVKSEKINITTPQFVPEPSSVQKDVTVAVSIMTSKIESWSERCEAEDKLKQFPTELVLKGLLEHFSKPMPSLAITHHVTENRIFGSERS